MKLKAACEICSRLRSLDHKTASIEKRIYIYIYCKSVRIACPHSTSLLLVTTHLQLQATLTPDEHNFAILHTKYIKLQGSIVDNCGEKNIDC